MSHRMLDGVTVIGASKSIKVGEHNTHHSVFVQFDEYGVTPVSAVVLKLQGSSNNENAVTGVTSNPAVALGSTKERVATGAFTYRIDNVDYSKGAVAAGTALPAAYTIANTKYGAFNLYINAAGTITYGFPAALQSYATAITAIAAVEAITADASGVPIATLCYVGRVLVYNNTLGTVWTSVTDDLETGADVTNGVFTDAPLNWYDMTTITFSGGQLTAQSASYTLVDSSAKFIRHNLTTLTGTGRVYSWHSSGPKS